MGNTALGAATATWPLAARAQQPALPVIGFLNAGSPAERTKLVIAFRHALGEAGYIEGQTVAFEYRWGDQQYDLTALVAELVALKVDVIATVGVAPWAAKQFCTVIDQSGNVVRFGFTEDFASFVLKPGNPDFDGRKAQSEPDADDHLLLDRLAPHHRRAAEARGALDARTRHPDRGAAGGPRTRVAGSEGSVRATNPMHT